MDILIIIMYMHVVLLADVDLLANLLYELAAYWEVFLGQLGLPQYLQDRIKTDNGGLPMFSVRCLLDGLHHWVQSDDRPTYGRITAVLRGSVLNNEVLAKRVEQFVESHTSQSQPTDGSFAISPEITNTAKEYGQLQT